MKTRLIKRVLYLLGSVFLIMNIVAYFHAYKFTHFAIAGSEKTQSPAKLGFTDKLQALVFGVNNPRPTGKRFPQQKFLTVKLKSNVMIECWNIPLNDSKGTVILFHGYGSEKSAMLEKSDEFQKMGYSTLLVDFMGSGGSEGNRTTIGFMEAEQVRTAYNYLAAKHEKNIYLFGTSLGAAAVTKAIGDFNLPVSGIILECPFGSMYETTCARFTNMNIPAFPMAPLLVFWGGVQNGFWGFSHRPSEYAKNITCPTLLLYGQMDNKVSRREIDEIYQNLRGAKTLRTYKQAGHENFLTLYKPEWVADVSDFIKDKRFLETVTH